MATRNFEFRRSPRHGQRGGRYVLGGSTVLTSGVPVVTDGTFDVTDRANVVLATGATNIPEPGKGGILVYENVNYHGYDPVQVTYSDVDQVRVGDPVQVVTGKTVKVALINNDEDFLNRTDYPTSRIMVAGVSIATPTVAVGNYLTPGVGNATDGYWAETANAAEAWLIVTFVGDDFVEAELNF
jgi:hypothetical protein